jgi:hypothetical protein
MSFDMLSALFPIGTSDAHQSGLCFVVSCWLRFYHPVRYTLRGRNLLGPCSHGYYSAMETWSSNWSNKPLPIVSQKYILSQAIGIAPLDLIVAWVERLWQCTLEFSIVLRFHVSGFVPTIPILVDIKSHFVLCCLPRMKLIVHLDYVNIHTCIVHSLIITWLHILPHDCFCLRLSSLEILPKIYKPPFDECLPVTDLGSITVTKFMLV